MKRSAVLLLLLAPLAGCVNDPGPDLDAYDGPYYDTGGAYYADPREFDYTVEQRALYGRTYYYPPSYPYYYGGYGRPGGWRRGYDGRHDDHGDYGRRNTDDARGIDRDRTRDDRGPAPIARPDDGDSPRVIPSRPSKIATENRSPPSRSSGSTGNRAGGPHGGGRR